MATLLAKNVPDRLHRKIQAYAKRRSRTMRDVVLVSVKEKLLKGRRLIAATGESR